MKTTHTRNLMAAALKGALVLIATIPSDAAEAQADVSGPAPKGGNGSGDNAAELAKKLQNPVADLISAPIQNNWDFGIGPADAMRYTVNVQPVIPFSLNQGWNLITRTIMPFIHAESPVPGGSDAGGSGDIVQSFFFSPKDPVGGWIVGGGPVFLYPAASDDVLGAEKWGAGPTAVLLKQENGWTYGALSNHLWSFAGEDNRQDVNATFLQPFLAYTTKTFTTFTLNTESTYDWENSQWTVPLNVIVSQLVKIGQQPIQFAIGGRYYVEKPEGGPDWGLRFAVTFLFPK
ncbi:MAG: transporter [Gammaproteobacteria bacterium]